MENDIGHYSREAETVTDAGEPCVCDDHLLFVQKHIASVETFVDNASGVQIAHPCGYLLHDTDSLLHDECLPPDVQVFVESVATAETAEEKGWSSGCGNEVWLNIPSDDGQVWWIQRGSHEQSQVVVSCFLQNGDLPQRKREDELCPVLSLLHSPPLLACAAASCSSSRQGRTS